MIKYCFAYFNKLGCFFGQPFFTDHRDIVPVLKQGLFAAKKEELEVLKEDELHYLGSFDNETGVFVPEKEMICSMSGLATDVLAKKFGVAEDHGQA